MIRVENKLACKRQKSNLKKNRNGMSNQDIIIKIWDNNNNYY